MAIITNGAKKSKSQTQIEEIIRCGKDPVHFTKTYCKIQHAVKGLIPFQTHPFQDDCLKKFQKFRRNVVLKSRQLGLSTVCAAYCVWMAIFRKDKNILVIATKLSTAQNFIKKCLNMLEGLPEWLLLTTFDPTKQVISFSNGSQIKAIPTSPDAGRSEAISLLIIDEAAFIRGFDEIWTGLSPTISTGGDVIVLSTPNGVGGQYYKLWIDSQTGENGFNPIKLMWDVWPGHDQKWFENETKNLSKKSIAQEFLCDFIASGDTFLQASALEVLRYKIRSPAARAGVKNEIWIWEEPEPDKQYIISADVARGDAKDYSAFHIIDVDKAEVVVEYMGKTPPEALANDIIEWGTKYNFALAMPENNTFGYAVVTKLRAAGYKHLYYHIQNSFYDPFEFQPEDDTLLPGFPTNSKTRVQILTKLEELLRNDILKIHSQRTYDQLNAFIWNGNKPQAAKGGYDDLVMSLAIGCWLINSSEGIHIQNMKVAHAIAQATSASAKSASMLPSQQTKSQFLQNLYNKQKYSNSLNDAINRGLQRNIDYSWLL